MLALGIILLLLAVGITLVVLLGGADDAAQLELGSLEMSMSTWSVFLLGALSLLVLALGGLLVRSGMRAASRRRKDRKQLTQLERQLEERGAPTRTPGDETTTSPEGTGPDQPPSSPTR